jgi:hypothetical protein
VKKQLFYLLVFSVITLSLALLPVPSEVQAWGNEWVSYTAGNWHFDIRDTDNWQETTYQGQQRITTSGSVIRLYNVSTGTGFPLVFDSECTPESLYCNVDGDYIGHNGNTANPSPLPARDYNNDHDESWSWYRAADWAVDFRFRGDCLSGNCSGLGNNFLYAQTWENRTGFAVGYNMFERKWFYTHDNSADYLGSINNVWHTGRAQRIWSTWNMSIDGGNSRSYAARQTQPDRRGDRIMTNLNLGNLQQINAYWPEISLDYVNVWLALPDAWINTITTAAGGAPVLNGPPPTFERNTDIRVNITAGDIRGVGTVSYSINTATDGSSSGSWVNFANQNGAGAKDFTGAATLSCAANPGICNGTHLVIANTLDVYGNQRQQWNLETRLQRQVRWAAPAKSFNLTARLYCPDGFPPPWVFPTPVTGGTSPVATPTPTPTPVGGYYGSPPTLSGAVTWQYYIRAQPNLNTRQIVGSNSVNFGYTFSFPGDEVAYFGVLRNGLPWGQEMMLNANSLVNGDAFFASFVDQVGSPDCPGLPTPRPQAVTFNFSYVCPAGPGQQVEFPAAQVRVHSAGEPEGVTGGQVLPVLPDLTQWGRWQSWFGAFAAPTTAGVMSFHGDGNTVAIQRSFNPADTPGVKWFTWGPGSPAETWAGTPYFEIWGGLTPDFDTYLNVPPGETRGWQEMWSVVDAN